MNNLSTKSCLKSQFLLIFVFVGRRIVTLMRGVQMLVTELRSLFVGYFSYLMKIILGILEDSEIVSLPKLRIEATEYVLSALQACFMYDNGNFVNAERFKILVPAVLDQLVSVLCLVAELSLNVSSTANPQ